MCHGIVFLLCPYEFPTQRGANAHLRRRRQSKINPHRSFHSLSWFPTCCCQQCPAGGAEGPQQSPTRGFLAKVSCDRLGTLQVALSFGKTLNLSAKVIFTDVFDFVASLLVVTKSNKSVQKSLCLAFSLCSLLFQTACTFHVCQT